MIKIKIKNTYSYLSFTRNFLCNWLLEILVKVNLFLCRRVIHTVGPKYAVKYHTAAENALSHCYRSCLELLIENGLERFLKLLFLSYSFVS